LTPLDVHSGAALPLGELGGCLWRWPKGGPKIQLCGSESGERAPKKEMNMMNTDETHVHAFYEKMKVLRYFRFAAEGVLFFLLISASHILGKLRRN